MGFFAWDTVSLFPVVPSSASVKLGKAAWEVGENSFKRAGKEVAEEVGSSVAKTSEKVADNAATTASNASKTVNYGPVNPGPLSDDIADTFRSGTYTAKTVDEPTTLYRVTSDSGNKTGSYWTRVEPQGPLQSVIDSAIDQNWGNTASLVVKIEVPSGTRIYEGASAAQRGLVGGGNQIYIPKVDSKWIVP